MPLRSREELPTFGRTFSDKMATPSFSAQVSLGLSTASKPGSKPVFDHQLEKLGANGILDTDLHRLVFFLLDGGRNAEEQRNVLQVIERTLRTNGPVVLDKWSGPLPPLVLAARAGRVDLARVLLKARVDANTTDPKGVGALHWAVYNGNVDLCRILLAAHASPDACDFKILQAPLAL